MAKGSWCCIKSTPIPSYVTLNLLLNPPRGLSFPFCTVGIITIPTSQSC